MDSEDDESSEGSQGGEGMPGESSASGESFIKCVIRLGKELGVSVSARG